MELLNLDQLKDIELNILIEFDDFCKKNDLKYSLTAGTLLGAIRHKGFIPWDDDIDVMMPRNDYNKLMILYKEKCNYKLLKFDKGYYYPFAKMIDKNTKLIEDDRIEKNIGVYIDIFPIDYYSVENEEENKKVRDYYLKKIGRMTFKSKKNLIKYMIKCMIFPFKKTRVLKLINKLNSYANSMTNDIKSKYSCAFMNESVAKNNGFYGWDIFENGVRKIKFENFSFDIINDYDKFLEYLYGNYMELPPIEKRVAHHNFEAFKIK